MKGIYLNRSTPTLFVYKKVYTLHETYTTIYYRVESDYGSTFNISKKRYWKLVPDKFVGTPLFRVLNPGVIC